MVTQSLLALESGLAHEVLAIAAGYGKCFEELDRLAKKSPRDVVDRFVRLLRERDNARMDLITAHRAKPVTEEAQEAERFAEVLAISIEMAEIEIVQSMIARSIPPGIYSQVVCRHPSVRKALKIGEFSEGIAGESK